MFKAVYILIANKDNYYAEQALVSMYSLKRHNPSVSIALIVDAVTDAYLKSIESPLMNYVDEFVVADVSDELTDVQKSRFLKTSIRQLVKGDFLYLDNDTIVTAPLGDIQDVTHDIAAVADHHEENPKSTQIEPYLAKTGHKKWKLATRYYNGGIIWAKDTHVAHAFFYRWHDLWNSDRERFGLSSDQPTLNRTNGEMEGAIGELDGHYNCQIFMRLGVCYMFHPKIVHYFHGSPTGTYYPLKNEMFLKGIRQNGVSPSVEKLVDEWYMPLLENWLILEPQPGDPYSTPMAMLGIKLGRIMPWTNKIAKALYRLLGKRV